MIHTVRIDDTTRNGKKLIADLRRYRIGISYTTSMHTATCIFSVYSQTTQLPSDFLAVWFGAI